MYSHQDLKLKTSARIINNEFIENGLILFQTVAREGEFPLQTGVQGNFPRKSTPPSCP